LVCYIVLAESALWPLYSPDQLQPVFRDEQNEMRDCKCKFELVSAISVGM